VPRTPIARVAYRWAEATGNDDLLLVERGGGLATAVALVGRRGVGGDGAPLDAGALPVGDIDALVSELRAEALGDRLIAVGRCPACAAAVDVEFSLTAFRRHRRPRRPRGVTPATDPGWWVLAHHDGTFRLPSAADVLAVEDEDVPGAVLAQRCVRVGRGGGRSTLRAAERAMAALGPTLRDDVEGTCPDCGTPVPLDVDARELCLEELRFLAHGVLEDVHVLAGEYGWGEEAILDLPVRRRAAYAELVRASRGIPVSAEAFGG
jgi:hypothetical protein